MEGNRHKLEHGKLQSDIRKYYFFFLFFVLKYTVRVIKCKNRLLKEVVESPSLVVFKTQLEKTLSNLLYLTGFMQLVGLDGL